MNHVQVLSRSGLRPATWALGLGLAGALLAAIYWFNADAPAPQAPVAPSTPVHAARTGSSPTAAEALTLAERLSAQAFLNIDSRPWDPAQLFELDAHGQLVLDERLLDRLTSLHVRLSNPEQAGTTLAALQQAFRQGLPPAQANEAMRLVNAYQAYEEAEQAHMQTQPIPAHMDEVRADQQRRVALQERLFGPTQAQHLFGQRNEQALVVAEAALLAADTSIPLAQRQAQIEALRLRLPVELRAAIVDPD